MSAEVRSAWLPTADELRRRRKRYFAMLCIVFPLSVLLGIQKGVEFIANPQWTFLPLLDLVIWVGIFPIMWARLLVKGYQARNVADG